MHLFKNCFVPKWLYCVFQVTSSDELFRSTDGCSLSSLKSLDELLAKQRSELLTRLFLMLASVTNESDNEGEKIDIL